MYKHTIILKLLKCQAKRLWVERPIGLIKRGGGAHALKVRFSFLLNESRECFKRVNICNQSKSLHDTKYARLWSITYGVFTHPGSSTKCHQVIILVPT